MAITIGRAAMTAALIQLGAVAFASGHTITLVVVGGAAMVLRYQSREATKDVDAFFITPPERADTRTWAAAVARDHDLPADWLNDGAKGFMQGMAFGPLLIDAPGIVVYQVADEQLLAMKLSAWRDQVDIDDATAVLRQLRSQYVTKDALWTAVQPFVVDPKAFYALEELWGEFDADT